MHFSDSNWFLYGILPVIIFFARICDVTIGTIRIILVAKGQKKIAPILGFFEVFIWILAIGQIMSHLDNFVCYIGYAAGFATGNYIGMIVEEKLAMGNLIVRIIIQKNAAGLISTLHSQGFGATIIDASGRDGRVNIIYTIVSRKQFHSIEKILTEFYPQAFYSIQDVRSVKNGIVPDGLSEIGGSGINPFKRWRKGK